MIIGYLWEILEYICANKYGVGLKLKLASTSTRIAGGLNFRP
jgi:hypothetical protein